MAIEFDNEYDRETERLINQTQDIARAEAREHKTYIVYKRDDGEIVKEWWNGLIEIIKERHG